MRSTDLCAEFGAARASPLTETDTVALHGELADFLCSALSAPTGREAEKSRRWFANLPYTEAAEYLAFEALWLGHKRVGAGIAKVRVVDDGVDEFFDFDPTGALAFIFPVYRIDPERWRQFVWPGILSPDGGRAVLRETVDLVALHPAHPQRWARRTGAALYLGEPGAYEDEDSMPVWRTPAAWLAARGDGVCCLSRRPAEIFSMLVGIKHLIAEDRRHATELRAICERPFTAPRIGVA